MVQGAARLELDALATPVALDLERVPVIAQLRETDTHHA